MQYQSAALFQVWNLFPWPTIITGYLEETMKPKSQPYYYTLCRKWFK